MAKLKDFRSDIRAINDGVWVPVHEAFGDLEIQVRGFTDAFHDARTLRTIAAAEPYGNDKEKIPNADQRRINASLMEDYLIIGVRNLIGDNGEPVELEEFHRLLYLPDYARLSRSCWLAAGQVSARSATQIEDAVKNLPSGSNSN